MNLFRQDTVTREQLDHDADFTSASERACLRETVGDLISESWPQLNQAMQAKRMHAPKTCTPPANPRMGCEPPSPASGVPTVHPILDSPLSTSSHSQLRASGTQFHTSRLEALFKVKCLIFCSCVFLNHLACVKQCYSFLLDSCFILLCVIDDLFECCGLTLFSP